MVGADFGELSRLVDRAPRLILFAGKGGVGKTTCAAATAIALAGRGPTLIFSTDPAHSLADALAQPLRSEPEPVAGLPGLHALEVDAEAALARFRARYGAGLAALISTTTFLSTEEVSALVGLPLPGIDELMGLGRVVELLAADTYRYLVWDSAPTGHTLRLLALPELLDLWVRFVAALEWRYRDLRVALPPRQAGEEIPSDGLFALKRLIHQFRALMRDPVRTLVVAVTSAEPVAQSELIRTWRRLAADGLRIGGVIVNRLAPDSSGCPHCHLRRQNQEASLSDLQQSFPTQAYYRLPELSSPPRGIAVLGHLVGTLPEQGRPPGRDA